MLSHRSRQAVLTLAAVLGGGSSVCPPALAAQWPVSIVGTWNGTVDTTAEQLVIATQAASGTCRIVTGTMSDQPGGAADMVQGFYCPGSGRVGLIRNMGSTTKTYQALTGSLSQTATPQLMAGLCQQERVLQGSAPLGEYGFSFSR